MAPAYIQPVEKVPPQLPVGGKCKLAFVGEAPSDEELIDLVPFVGPAGKVYDIILRGANIDRSEVLTTNLFDEQAPGNDVSAWMRDKDRVAESAERLNKELTACQPNVVVPLGASALWGFTGETAITPFRGTVFKASRIVPGQKIVPTYHPSFIQRGGWKYLPIAIADVIKAAGEADKGPEVRYERKQILIRPLLREALDFIASCEGRLTAPDIETGWGEITCVGLSPEPYTTAMCIPFLDFNRPDRNYWSTAEEELTVWKALRDFFEGPTRKVGQNFVYDAMWLWKKRGIRTFNYTDDTRLMHHALFPELPKDLAFLSASYTNLGPYKQWSGRYAADNTDK